MSIMNITITNEIAPRAIIALFDGFTKDPVRNRLKRVSGELTQASPKRSVFRH